MTTTVTRNHKPRFTPKPDASTPFGWNASNTAVLKAIGYFHEIGHKDLTILLFSRLSQSFTRMQTRQLFDHGFVMKLKIPHAYGEGSPPDIFVLTNKGYRVFCEMTHSTPRRYRVSEAMERSAWVWRPHQYDSTRFLVIACSASRSCPLTLRNLVTEYEYRELAREHKLQTVELTPSKKASITIKHVVQPDCSFDLEYQGSTTRLIVEVDRGTEHNESQLRAKFAGLTKAYHQDLGRLHVLVTAPTDARRNKLWQLCGSVLTSMGTPQLADLFRFATVDLEEDTGHRLFFDPIWLAPFDAAGHRLVGG